MWYFKAWWKLNHTIITNESSLLTKSLKCQSSKSVNMISWSLVPLVFFLYFHREPPTALVKRDIKKSPTRQGLSSLGLSFPLADISLNLFMSNSVTKYHISSTWIPNSYHSAASPVICHSIWDCQVVKICETLQWDRVVTASLGYPGLGRW